MYVTGGLGADGRTEAFGADYALPNRAYAETCASIGGMLWYHRMFLREAKTQAYDALERTLYNGYLSGVSLAGDTFFYQNPLVSDGRAGAQHVFRRRLLPGEPRAADGGAAGADLRAGRPPGLREPVHRQRSERSSSTA